MTIVENNSRYITHATVEKCFETGVVTHVNKVLCGNGFSTAFITTKPPEGKINIIIAPNKQVLISKKESFGASPGNKIRIKFFYEEGTDTNFNHADVLMFVTDSFLLYKRSLMNIAGKIHWVLIDEYHSVEIQSLFRYRLVEFLDKIKWLLINSAVATVTATPNHGAPVNILIKNNYTMPLLIHFTIDKEASIERARLAVRNKKKVVVFTNNVNVAKQFRTSKGVLNAKLMVGEAFARSLVARCIVKDDPGASLIIATSRAFEGVDIDWMHTYVFFYDNRSNQYETFYISNLYQAINRPRNTPAYIEWGHTPLQELRKTVKTRKQVMAFIADKKMSVEEKANKSNSNYHQYVIFDIDQATGKMSVRLNEVAMRLSEEVMYFDQYSLNNGQILFDNDVIVKQLHERWTNLPVMKVKSDNKAKMLLENAKMIEERDLFGSKYICEPKQIQSFSGYYFHLKDYLICKNYNGKRVQRPIETKALELLKDRKLAHRVSTMHYERKKLSIPQAQRKEYIDNFRLNAERYIGELIISLINEIPYFRKEWVAHRNYNVLTMLGYKDIEYVCGLLGVTVLELDIKSCFPRLCYALAGEKLPDDFYGEHGTKEYYKRKVRVNTVLNTIKYDETSKTIKAVQKQNSLRSLRTAGFNDNVSHWIVDNFFDAEYKGDFFNFMAFHEKIIISDVKSQIKKTGGQLAVERRHDSIVVFNPGADYRWVKSYAYLNQTGWF